MESTKLKFIPFRPLQTWWAPEQIAHQQGTSALTINLIRQAQKATTSIMDNVQPNKIIPSIQSPPWFHNTPLTSHSVAAEISTALGPKSWSS